MQHSIKIKGLLAVSIAISLALGGCSGSGSTASDDKTIPKPDVKCEVPKENLDDSKVDTSKAKGEITFMTQNLKKDFSPFFEEIIAKFEKENPGAKIIWQDKPGGPDFDKRMMADAVECHMADVINVPSQTVRALSQPNFLLDLDVKAPGIGDKFVKELWDGSAVGHNDHHTGLPWYTTALVTTYNEEVFKRAGADPDNPPKTMDEIFELGHKISAAKTGDYAIYGNANWYLSSQILGMGAKLMNKEHTEFTFAKEPAAKKWVEEMAKLYKEGAIPKDSLTGEPDPNKAYFEGNLAIGTPNPSFLRAVKKNNPKVYEVTGVTTFPLNDGVALPVNSQYIAVSAATKNAPLAVKFAEYMTNAENELAWTRDGGAIIFPPASEALDKIVADPPEIAKDKVFHDAYEVAAKSIQEGKYSKSLDFISGSVQKALVDNINKGVRGEVSAEEALQMAQDEMNKLLKRAQ